MVRLVHIFILVLAFAVSAFATTFFSLPNGSGTACTLGSPCGLSYALTTAGPVESGDTLCISKGTNVTYYGRFYSFLVGATIRSCDATGSSAIINPSISGWATIDGNATTTLAEPLDNSEFDIDLTTASGTSAGTVILVDSERMSVASITGNTVSVTRGWDGTSAVTHSNGATVTILNDMFKHNGANNVFRDFEITNTNTSRDNSGDWNNNVAIRGGGLGIQSGSGNSLINLIIHETIVGIGTGPSTTNTLIYGVLDYNNGTYNPVAGYGMYLENASGYSRLYDIMVFNNYDYAAQLFSTAATYEGGDLQRSMFAGSGAPVGTARKNMAIGVQSTVINALSIDDCHFNNPSGAGTANFSIGIGDGITTATITDTYIIGGETSFQVEKPPVITNLIFTGNKVDNSTSAGLTVGMPQGYTGPVNSNAYYTTGTSDTRFYNYTTDSYQTFANWKTATGYDASSTINAGALPDTVIVNPNAYETGRANIFIYAASSPSSINVNLATTGLVNGQAYTIRNAFDFFDTAVATGTYNSGSTTISVSIGSGSAARNVSTPTGGSSVATNCPTFCAMVVLPGAIQAGGIGGSAKGAVSFKGAVTIK